MTSAVQLAHIYKRYGPTVALDGVDLTVAPGEVHALMGENGAGKSTLLKILSGAVRPDDGTMTVAERGVPLDGLTPQGARQLGIGIVHQEFSLIPSMTVAENVFLGREPRRGPFVDRRAMHDRAAELLERLRSRVHPGTLVERLGVADAQLVEIAKALAGDVAVLAMDEPSAVLSGVELSTLFEVVAELAGAGTAVLYVSHRLDEVFEICERYTVLKDGVVAASGTIADTDSDQLVSAMVGRNVSSAFPLPGTEPGPVRLRLEDFRVHGLAAPASLGVRAGEIVGFAGLQGSGRTRLAKGIFGEIPAAGMLEIDGTERRPFRSVSEAIAAGIAYLPEDRKSEGLALDKTVRWNASMLRLPSLRGRARLIDAQLERDLVSSMIDRLSIKTESTGDDRVRTLSGGNQQKVVVGKWLELAPAVAIFDEPTRGIDVGSKEQIYGILRSLADSGVAVIVISSELIEVIGLSDRILVMADGAIVGELPGHESTEEDVMRMITLGHQPVSEVQPT